MFKLPIDKNYYKPILVKSGYNGNYIQYESKGDKILTLKEYLALTLTPRMPDICAFLDYFSSSHVLATS